MDLFLLLTALLCGLTGASRDAVARAPAVETAHVVQVAQVAMPQAMRAVAERPDGYVAVEPWPLDLTVEQGFIQRITPERRRE